MEEKTYLDRLSDFAWNYGPNLLLAVALLIGGLWVIKKITHVFASFLKARNVDLSLQPFFSSMIDVAMKVALLLVVAGKLGIETTSFIAIFSAIAFAIGLALQGSLGNFASGVLILLFRPYKIGDIISIDEKMGAVREIQIFNTILLTPQGKKIIIPNGKITEGAIENITMEGEVRAEMTISVKDKTSIPVMRAAATHAALSCKNRLEKHAPFVEVDGFQEDGMRIIVGCWTTGEYYWDTYYELTEKVKTAFDEAGIELAQRDED